MEKWTWKSAPDLMARLMVAQNSERNANVDITTFASMCESREELERHVTYYESRK